MADARDWLKEYNETGEHGYIDDMLTELGNAYNGSVYNLPNVDARLMSGMGYQGNWLSPYVSTFGSDGRYGNFTPISYDWDADETRKILRKEELEQYANDVLSGKRQDDLGLQLSQGNVYSDYNQALEDAVKANYLKKFRENVDYKMYDNEQKVAEDRVFNPIQQTIKKTPGNVI